MEFFTAMPEWLAWCATGAMGALALATIARMLQAAMDLEAN